MIWNKFMQVAKGAYCGDFPRPKSTMSWSPFFGRYSKGGTEYSIGGDSYNPGDSTGGGYQGYDPRLYGEPNGSPPADNGGGGTGGGTGGAQ
jgi:hypothetical protein